MVFFTDGCATDSFGVVVQGGDYLKKKQRITARHNFLHSPRFTRILVPRRFLCYNTHFRKCKETIKRVERVNSNSLKSNLSGFSEMLQIHENLILPYCKSYQQHPNPHSFSPDADNKQHLCLHSIGCVPASQGEVESICFKKKNPF